MGASGGQDECAVAHRGGSTPSWRPSTLQKLTRILPMGRQWLQAKREVAGLKKGQMVGKLVKEIMVASKLGGPEPDGNPRLFAAVEKARRQSVTRDVIERAIKKGAGIGAEKLVLEHVVFEGYTPHKVP